MLPGIGPIMGMLGLRKGGYVVKRKATKAKKPAQKKRTSSCWPSEKVVYGAKISNGIASNHDILTAVNNIGFHNLKSIAHIKHTGNIEHIGLLPTGYRVVNAKQKKAFETKVKKLKIKDKKIKNLLK